MPDLRQLTPPLKPSAICIGAQKSGTTALYEYLSLHPDVLPSKVKEIDFFNCNTRYAKGLDFYHSHFPRKPLLSGRKLTFDITPGYLPAADPAAQRIHAYDRRIKIIALLRNPTRRAFSAWQMYRTRWHTTPGWFGEWVRGCDSSIKDDYFVRRPPEFGESFETDIADEIKAMEGGRIIEMPILWLGMYSTHLKHYYDRFAPEQILVISSEDMRQDTAGQLRRIEEFVGLQPYNWPAESLNPRFQGAYDETPSAQARSMLQSFYRDHNRALFSLLGREFAWEEA
ncbi:MAG TPA: sulfotransferase domain-containing protein [Candidatus Acidoferrum sp.]|nr:sulfotransferase domain-containing protein [Candidatus Acidoferrum sp.]